MGATPSTANQTTNVDIRSSTTLVNENDMTVSLNTAISNSNSAGSSASANSDIEADAGADGNVNFDGVTVKQQAKCSVKVLLNQQTNLDFVSALTEKAMDNLKKNTDVDTINLLVAKASQAGIGWASANTDSNTNMKADNETLVKNVINQTINDNININNAASVLSDSVINSVVKLKGKNINISNVTIDQSVLAAAELMSFDKVSNKISSDIQKNLSITDDMITSDKTKTKEESIAETSLMGFIGLFIVIAVILVLGFYIYNKVKSGGLSGGNIKLSTTSNLSE